MQNEISVRNKIEMRVILMGVYGDEGEMDVMQCKMRLRCGTNFYSVGAESLTQRGNGAEGQRF